MAMAAARSSLGGANPVIKAVEMPDDLKEAAVEISRETLLQTCKSDHEMATQIKKTFDSRFGPTWHCVVGRNFASCVTHEAERFIYLYLEHSAVLLFKSKQFA